MTNQELRISLDLRSTLPIPYNKEKRDDGENFGYFDIKNNIEYAKHLPEIADSIYLQNAIIKVNQTNKIETARCVRGFYNQNSSDYDSICVGVVFSDAELFASRTSYFHLAETVLSQIQQLDLPFAPLLEIGQAAKIGEGLFGWIADLYLVVDKFDGFECLDQALAHNLLIALGLDHD